ncbi:MAG: hypothetical protein ACFFDN_08555 [Candidatus Hodarchaeota archaeon]
MASLINGKTLCVATAAYFSSRGYFVRRNFDIQGIGSVDIVAIMPRLSDLKKRIKSKYFVPSGILYTLINQKWKSTEEIAAETDSTLLFVSSILDELCEERWVEKKKENNRVLWRLEDYKIPSKDLVMAYCTYRDCNAFLENLNKFEGCYNKMYFIFPYPIDEEFIDLCQEKGVGIMIFYEKVGFFKELLPPELKIITNLKVYANISEILIKENFLYRSIDSI